MLGSVIEIIVMVWMLVAMCLWAVQTILIRFLPKGMDLVAFKVAAFVAKFLEQRLHLGWVARWPWILQLLLPPLLCIALWLAFYLLARGFPSRITLRTVVVLIALATFFLSASINLHLQIPGATNLRAVVLVVALVTLYDLTNKILPDITQKKNNWAVATLYALALITIPRAARLGERSSKASPAKTSQPLESAAAK